MKIRNKSPPRNIAPAMLLHTSKTVQTSAFTQFVRVPDASLAGRQFVYPIPRRTLQKVEQATARTNSDKPIKIVAAKGDDDLMNQPQS